MGDMADYCTEEGYTLWLDHLWGHPDYPDQCPYCEDDIEQARLITENEK